MAEEITDTAAHGEPHVEIRTVAPLRTTLVERDGLRAYLVAERLEQPPQKIFPATARQHRKPGRQIQLLLRQLRTFLALAAQRGSEHLAKGNAQQRGSHIRPVVHIRSERKWPAPAAAYQCDRVHLNQQRDGAALRLRRRVEGVRHAEGKLDRARGRRVLVQQEPKVRRGRRRAGDGEQHRFPCLGRRSAYARADRPSLQLPAARRLAGLSARGWRAAIGETRELPATCRRPRAGAGRFRPSGRLLPGPRIAWGRWARRRTSRAATAGCRPAPGR